MEDASEQNEADLLAKAVDGDSVALELLLLDYSKQLSRHITAHLPSEMQDAFSAEDILQETFIKVFSDIHRFRSRTGSSFLAWLKTLADNRLRDAIKTAKRKKRGGGRHRQRQAAAGSGSSLTDFVEMLSAGSHQSPSKSAARHEAEYALQVAIAELPEEYRQAIRLRFLSGLRIEEVASIMGRSEGSVRGLLDRAKKKLHASLGRSSLYMSRKE